jgi:LacI family transcriptional regulator
MTQPDTAKHWTIYDIAKEAGVSAKTVSKVLNDKAGVAEKTRARVLEIIERVGYQPHIGARSLRGGGTACIGVTLPVSLNVVPISEDVLLWMFGRLLKLFGSRGEYICFDINPYGNTFDGDYARGLWQQLYRACVVAGPLPLDDTTVKRIHEWGAPYVVLSRLDGFPELSCATVDFEQGAYESTKFLLARGHRRIAMLKAFSGFQPGIERRRGYVRALEEAGIQPDETLIRGVSFDAQDVTRCVHRLLLDRKVTALIDCSATEDGASLRGGARRAGRTLGNDLEILTWSYREDEAVLPEACAQMWLPQYDATGEGFDELAAWFHGERQGPIHVIYRPTLLENVPEIEIARPRRLFGGST